MPLARTVSPRAEGGCAGEANVAARSRHATSASSGAFQQRERWPVPTAASGGGSAAAVRVGEGAAAGEAAAGEPRRTGVGTLPEIVVRRSRVALISGMEPSSPTV